MQSISLKILYCSSVLFTWYSFVVFINVIVNLGKRQLIITNDSNYDAEVLFQTDVQTD